jgi:hypothetical protein
MKLLSMALTVAAVIAATSCATPPTSDPSSVESICAQHCSSDLATCGSGFKLFPIVQQKQCNDVYDVCIKGCPARKAEASNGGARGQSAGARLMELDELLKSGAISKEEYDAKRKAILDLL